MEEELRSPGAGRLQSWVSTVRFCWLALLYFSLLVLIVYFHVLLQGGTKVLSLPFEDVQALHIPLRTFGFEQWRQGNFTLWNPRYYAGAPFLGFFQSAMLYPLNWIHLVLPMCWAINVLSLVHFILAGWFAAMWAHSLGLGRMGSLVAGTVYVCSAGLVMHAHSGHLIILECMAWAPLILLSIDQVIARPNFAPLLRGVFAIAMAIFAGHPQSVYFVAVVAGVYAVFRLALAERRWRAVAFLAAMGVWAGALTAVQMLPGLEAAGETSRAGGTSYEFATAGKLELADLFMFVAPHFWGPDKASYTRPFSMYWEACMFVGVGGLALAIFGAVYGQVSRRWVIAAMVVVTLVLSLGDSTPLFRLMYDYVPGYNQLRVTSRYNILLCLFLGLLTGMGVDAVLARQRWRYSLGVTVLIVALLLALVGWCVTIDASSGRQGAWAKALADGVRAKPENVLPDAIGRTAGYACKQMLVAAGTAVVLGVAMLLCVRWPAARFAVAGIVMVELMVFSWKEAVTSDPFLPYPQQWLDLRELRDPDWRHCHANFPYGNSGLFYGFDELYGYDALLLKNYSDVLSFSQGGDPDKEYYVPTIVRLSKLFAMLRVKVVHYWEKGVPKEAYLDDPLPRFLLMGEWRVMADRKATLATLESPSFDLRKTVILESEPSIKPSKAKSPGEIKVIREDTDSVELTVRTDAPQILLVTDIYSKGWHARAMPGSSQQAYDIQPANRALRAIPLSAGQHHFVMEYMPATFKPGVVLTLVALALLVAASIYQGIRSSRDARRTGIVGG